MHGCVCLLEGVGDVWERLRGELPGEEHGDLAGGDERLRTFLLEDIFDFDAVVGGDGLHDLVDGEILDCLFLLNGVP